MTSRAQSFSWRQDGLKASAVWSEMMNQNRIASQCLREQYSTRPLKCPTLSVVSRKENQRKSRQREPGRDLLKKGHLRIVRSTRKRDLFQYQSIQQCLLVCSMDTSLRNVSRTTYLNSPTPISERSLWKSSATSLVKMSVISPPLSTLACGYVLTVSNLVVSGDALPNA